MQSASCFSFFFMYHDNYVSFLTMIVNFLRALFLFQKSDSSLSDFFSDDDVNSSKKVTKTGILKKADPVNPHKDSNAFDQDQKVTETKLR